jgi:phosphonopyruvate decarboxylase
MGEKITDLLQILGIPFSILSDTDYCEEIEKAAKYIETNKIPYALIVRKDTFLKYTSPTVSTEKKFPCRYEYLDVLKQNISSEDILLGATGFTGREMNQLLPEHKGKFYMMGSMGCLPSIGLGLAKSFLQKRVIVLDGDGGTLMKLGSLSTLGYYSPENLIHICFNNNQYESTGGQETTSSTTDFCRIALACGYKSVLKIENPVEFIECLKSDNQVKKPVFLELMIQSGSPEALTRPSQTPVEMKNEFMSGL